MIRAPSITQQFRALFRPGDSWFDADRVLIDGGTGKVSALVDHMDPSHALAQSTSANQAALPSADAQLAGALGLPVTTSVRYESSRAASAWSYLQAFSPGCTWAMGAIVTGSTDGRWWTTTNGENTSNPGTALILNSTSSVLALRSWSSTGGALATLNSVGNAQTPRALHTARFYGVSAGAYLLRWDTATLASGTMGTASGAASRTLRIFNSHNNTNPCTVVWRFFFAWQRVLTASELAILSAHVRATCGGSI